MKVNDIESKKLYALYFSVASLCLLICLFLVFGGGAHYDTNDDVTLNSIAVGNYGEQNRAYLVFSNVCYGRFIEVLYNLAGGVNWYAVFPLAVAAFCFILVGILLVKAQPNIFGIALSFLFLYGFGYYIMVTVQFTHFAGFFSAVGLFFMFVGLLEDGGIYRFFSACGIVIALIGSMIRLDAFVSCAAVIGVCCLAKIIQQRFWKMSFRKIMLHASPFIVLFALVAVAGMINNQVYQSDPDWKHWRQYNELRASLLDYPLPAYEAYADEYAQAGIDELDFQMLTSWNYGDKNKFSIETMEKLCQLQQDYTKESNSSFRNVAVWILQSITQVLTHDILFSLVLAVGMGLALWRKRNLWLLLPLAVVVLELMYLAYNRRIVFRSYLGSWIAISLVVLWVFAHSIGRSLAVSRLRCIAVAMGMVVFATPWCSDIWLAQRQETEQIAMLMDKYRWREVLSQDDECLYIHETLFGGVPNTMLALEPLQQYNHNIYCLGGWTNPSPLQEYLLDEHDIQRNEVMPGLLDNNKNAYYIEMDYENNRERMLVYLRKEYNKDAQVEQINSIYGLNVYRFFVDEHIEQTSPEKIRQAYGLDKAVMTSDLQFEFHADVQDTAVNISGWCCHESIDPYKQNVWLRISAGDQEILIRGKKQPQPELSERFGNLHAAAAGVSWTVDRQLFNEETPYSFDVIIEGEDTVYMQNISECFTKKAGE